MNDKQRIDICKESIDMYDSLINAIDHAGGRIPKDIILNMTVLDLISVLCTNNIRFVFRKEQQ